MRQDQVRVFCIGKDSEKSKRKKKEAPSRFKDKEHKAELHEQVDDLVADIMIVMGSLISH